MLGYTCGLTRDVLCTFFLVLLQLLLLTVLGLRQAIKEAEAKNAAAAAVAAKDSAAGVQMGVSSNGNGVPAAAVDAASKVPAQSSRGDSTN